MLQLTRLLSLRYLRRHKLRVGLATLSIALGVATLTSARVLNHSTIAAMEGTATQLAGAADLQVTCGEQGVDLALLPQIQSTRGVAVAAPLLVKLVNAKLPDGTEQRALLLAIDLSSAQKARDYEVLLGLRLVDEASAVKPWEVPDAVFGVPVAAVGESLWKQAKGPFTFQLLTPAGWRNVAAKAVVPRDGIGAALGGHLIAMKLDPAFRYVLQPGQPEGIRRVTYIHVKVADGADLKRVQMDLAALVGTGGEVHPPRIRDTRLEDVLSGIQLGLLVGATVALFVGMFLVYNTLAVTVAERRHDIGILRSLGATQWQVRGLFTGEALVLGLLGSLVGLAGGLGLAQLSLETVRRVLLEQFSMVDLRELSVPVPTLVLGLVAGVGVSLFASLKPASAAAAESPSDALRRVPILMNPLETWWPLAAALLLAAIGLTFIYQREQLPGRWALYISLYFVGFAFMLATPFLARAGVALLRPFAVLLGTGARLAADDLARNPGRTGLTVGKLALGLAMTIETAGILLSTQVPVFDWVERTIRANLFVTSGSAITTGGGHTLMNAELGQALAAHPQIVDVMPVRLAPLDYGSTQVRLCSLPMDVYRRHNDITLTQSEEEEPLPRLLDPTERCILVSDNFAVQHRVKPGDELVLATGKHGRQSWRVLGTVRDYSWNRGTVFMHRATYTAWFEDGLVDVFDLFLHAGADPEAVRREIGDQLGATHQLVILNRAEFAGHIRRMMDQFYGLIYANAIMALLVSLLGVANALAISVLQRRREIGLLRAVGATRWQVAWSVSAQALFISVLGLALGVGLGMLLQYFVLEVLMIEEAGYFFAFLFPFTMTAVTAGFAVTAAQLAAALPAARAASQPISEAVAYE